MSVLRGNPGKLYAHITRPSEPTYVDSKCYNSLYRRWRVGNEVIVAQYSCPFDGPYGQIGFRLCSDGKTIVLMCDECGAVWLSPEFIEADNFLRVLPPNFVIPGIQCSVQFPESRWATRNEIIQYGWGNFILAENSSE